MNKASKFSLIFRQPQVDFGCVFVKQPAANAQNLLFSANETLQTQQNFRFAALSAQQIFIAKQNLFFGKDVFC